MENQVFPLTQIEEFILAMLEIAAILESVLETLLYELITEVNMNPQPFDVLAFYESLFSHEEIPNSMSSEDESMDQDSESDSDSSTMDDSSEEESSADEIIVVDTVPADHNNNM